MERFQRWIIRGMDRAVNDPADVWWNLEYLPKPLEDFMHRGLLHRPEIYMPHVSCTLNEHHMNAPHYCVWALRKILYWFWYFSHSQTHQSTVPWLNYHLVGVVYVSVGLLPVDMLQNIKAWHPSPVGQGAQFTFIKGLLGKDVVLNKKHPCLQDGRFNRQKQERQ